MDKCIFCFRAAFPTTAKTVLPSCKRFIICRLSLLFFGVARRIKWNDDYRDYHYGWIIYFSYDALSTDGLKVCVSFPHFSLPNPSEVFQEILEKFCSLNLCFYHPPRFVIFLLEVITLPRMLIGDAFFGSISIALLKSEYGLIILIFII